MKDFTNNNFNVNDFAHKDEARIRHISLKGLLIIFVIVFMIFGGIMEELDIDLTKEKYTISEIEDMAEDFWEDAEDMGYNRRLRESYAIRKLEDKGVKTDKYYIDFDIYGDANVEAK